MAMHRAWRFVADHWVLVAGLLVLAYLSAPVAVVVALSFNAGRAAFLRLHEFTLDNWADPCGPAELCSAVARSAQIGFLATLVATVLGTMMAFALARHCFRGRNTISVLVLLPMATPEVVLGSALLALFVCGASGCHSASGPSWSRM